MSYPFLIEDPLIVSWRKGELRREGYSQDQAENLAMRGDVDLHYAINLLRDGCPAEIAFEILW